MSNLVLDLVTFDPGSPPSHVEAYAGSVLQCVEQGWETGADLVLLPEFTWMGLEPLVAAGGQAPLRSVAEVFWQQVLPRLLPRLNQAGKAAVLGTAPCLQPDGSITNRAFIVADGHLLFQDKLHMTPWEADFTPGSSMQLWAWRGWKVAVIICLDIEIPELSARLRDSGVDLILCPSATETVLGVERVNRCASARSVELGCYVGVSHLTGRAASELIDDNIGRAAFYRPSQAVFKDQPRHEETELVTAGSHRLRVSLNLRALETMRRMTKETNPAHLGRKCAGLERSICVQSVL